MPGIVLVGFFMSALRWNTCLFVPPLERISGSWPALVGVIILFQLAASGPFHTVTSRSAQIDVTSLCPERKGARHAVSWQIMTVAS